MPTIDNDQHICWTDDTLCPDCGPTTLPQQAVYVAQADTAHFSFLTVGATAEQARASMARGLDAHADQHGLAADWFPTDEITVHQIPFGTVLRDGVGITLT